MIIGIGTDIVECDRIWKVCEKHGENFLQLILTPAEKELMLSRKSPTPFLAARWAAKEAFSKALGTGIGEKCTFADIEILPGEKGKPYVRLSGKTAVTAAESGVKKIHISLSHEKNYAVATILLEGVDT